MACNWTYSFRENYSFLNLEIQRSQYIRPKVTVHKCAETIQGRKLFKGGNYMRKYSKSYLVCSLVLHPLSIVPETALFFFFLKPVIFIPDISLHCIFFRFWIHVQYRQPSVSEHLVRQRSAEFKFLIFANSCSFGDLYLTPSSTHFNSSGKILLFSSISYASVWESVALWQSRSKRFSSPSCLVWQCQLFKLKEKGKRHFFSFYQFYQIYYILVFEIWIQLFLF